MENPVGLLDELNTAILQASLTGNSEMMLILRVLAYLVEKAMQQKQ